MSGQWLRVSHECKELFSLHTNLPTSTLQLQCEVEKPLLTFRGDNFKKDMKKYDHHIVDLRKQLVSRYAAVEKVGFNTREL